MTFDEIISAARHGVSYAAGMATLFGIQQIMGTSTADIQTDVNHIIHGAEEIWAGLGPLITLAMAWWAAHGAKLTTRVAAVKAADPNALVQAVQQVSPTTLRNVVAAQPEVKAVIVTSKDVADASPSPKVKT